MVMIIVVGSGWGRIVAEWGGYGFGRLFGCISSPDSIQIAILD